MGLLLAATTALLAPMAASAAPTYETFVGCDAFSENPAPADVCQVGDLPGAYFESDVDTEYEVCVEFPPGVTLCVDEQEAKAGVLYVNVITSETEGVHRVSWFVEGEEVGSWDFRLDPPPPPVAPIVTTPPAQPAIAPAPSVECLKAQRRIGALKSRLRSVKGHSQKARIRGKLKNARATAKQAC